MPTSTSTSTPTDLTQPRQAIPDVISSWNNTNAEANKVVLLPVKWETHSAPLLGDRAQAVINNQVVTSCDMAIGVFWTRLGSPTGVSESGTAEEIEWFIRNRKPAMVYFSSRSIDPTKLDIDQYKSLKEFEKKMQKIGLTGSYTSITDFKEKLLTQISINIRQLLTGTPVAPLTKEEVVTKDKTIKDFMKNDTIYMEDYEKDGQIKSIIVKGETKHIKEKLKALGGRWNGTLQGWIFTKSREIEIAEFIKMNH